MRNILTALIMLSASTTASANLLLEFKEGAPKDRFVLSNTGACTLTNMAVTIDLKNSAGKLIFDVTGDGAGVEVFQPFEIESGSDFVSDKPVVVDGQTEVTLVLTSLEAGKKVVVSTDVDDTIDAREITVNASEFAGTVIQVAVSGKTYSATVADKPKATVELPKC